jgi:hypothetical protein
MGMKFIQRLRQFDPAKYGLFVRESGHYGKCRGFMLPVWPVYGKWFSIAEDAEYRGWGVMGLMAWVATESAYRFAGHLDIRIGWGRKPVGKQERFPGQGAFDHFPVK